jgi:hypothetical protein
MTNRVRGTVTAKKSQSWLVAVMDEDPSSLTFRVKKTMLNIACIICSVFISTGVRLMFKYSTYRYKSSWEE